MGVWLSLLFCLPLDVCQDNEIGARFSVQPEQVELGQPFQLFLSVEHPTEVSVFDIQLKELQLDDSWVIFDSGRETAEPLAEQPGRSVTRWHWKLASLDAGERRLLNELIALVEDERVTSVNASETTIEVLSVLAEEEDQPRPLRGLPEGFGELTPAEISPLERALPGVYAFGLLCLAYGIWRFTRKGSSEPVEPSLAPLAELEQLRATPPKGAVELRARHFALTRLVRRATDEKRGTARTGLTDEEWLQELEALLRAAPPEADSALASLAADLTQYLQAAQGIKYAKADASEWALEETHGATRRILEALRQGNWPQPAAQTVPGEELPC